MADHAGPPTSPAEHVPAVFESSRLRLRPWREDDSPGPGEGPDDASLRFMPAGAQPGPADFSEWLERRRRDLATEGDLLWCVADLATDEMLGNVQVFRMGPVADRFQGELGFWLRPGARGRGVIGEAVEPVIAHAFRSLEDGGLGLSRLHAATDSDNYASRSILGAAGLIRWGADHHAWRRSDGSLADGVYFELLADTCRTSTAGFALNTLDALEPVRLEGHGARLRRWRHTDAGRIVEAGTDERTRRWLASLPSPYTLQDAHSFIAGCSENARSGASLHWCVADPVSDQCVGSISVMAMRDALGTTGEVGYWTHPDARGRGVMSEAVRLVVRHAFVSREDGGLGRRRLRLNAADGNPASQHIAVTNGFVEVGRDRRAEPLGDGSFVDAVRYDLLVDEWNAHG